MPGPDFTPAFGFFRAQQRRAMEALYAFMRHTDDLADGPSRNARASKALAAWRALP